jgi:hypothetical protein
VHKFSMFWEIETSDEFRDWYISLEEDEGCSVNAAVDLLERMGPALGRPWADTL